MPNMNGLQVLEFLKANQRFQKLHTIILTNYDEGENEIKGLQLGAIDYIQKPIQEAFLKARIDIHMALLRAEQVLEQKLDEQILTLETILLQAPIGIAILQSCNSMPSEISIVRINPAFEQIIGRTREELASAGWRQILHPYDFEEDTVLFQKLLSGEIKMYSRDKRFLKPDGSIVWVHMNVAPLTFFDTRQQNRTWICLVEDITERKQMETALYESERSKSVFLSHLPGLAYRCNYDRDWTMQYVSQGCLSLTGYSPESLLHNRDLSYNDIIAPEYHEALWNEWKRVLAAKEPFKFEYAIITANGERKWVLELGQGIFNEQGEVEALEGIVLDISDRKAIENTLKYQSEHNRLTGLYNREYLVSFLKKNAVATENSKKALIGIDLSMIHLLTARYGFQYSVNLIIKAAELLNRYSTEKRILFHPHENRFIFYVFDYRNKHELIDFCSKISAALESLFRTERINGGIGILEIDENLNANELDVDLLLRKLLIASERFVGLFRKDFEIRYYDDALEALVNRERDLVEALNGIAAGDMAAGDLYLQFQPILELKTGIISGFEALARLRTEKLGPVSPLEFIPLAEKTKLIIPIGEQVMRKAFEFLHALKAHGYPEISVSVNISVVQLLHPDFAVRMFELINEMQIPANKIGIEITESVFADYDCINHVIQKLQHAGIYIAIDDFGTGYSSLSREKELKADCIKIDKYFVDALLHEDLSKSITGDIISMSHKLGHSTIAEGVEHEIQLQYLKEHGCLRIQGYFVSKPLLADDAIRFLQMQK